MFMHPKVPNKSHLKMGDKTQELFNNHSQPHFVVPMFYE